MVKIISTITTIQLAPTLSQVISKEQSGLTKSESLVGSRDSSSLSSCKDKGECCFERYIDFTKAYDPISRLFILKSYEEI